MKTEVLSKLESDFRLKKKYLPKFFWAKNAAIYPPSIFIFFSLFGLLYLLSYDMLMTYYAIPFVLLFLLATIWLKNTKRYVLRKLFEQKNLFVICLGRIVKNQENKVFVLLTNGGKRHNKYFLQHLEKEVDLEGLVGDEVLEVEDIASSEDSVTYIKYLKKANVLKSGYVCNAGEFIPMFYVGDGNFVLIKRKDTLV